MKKSTADIDINLIKIREALKDFDWATVGDLNEATRIPTSTIQRVIERSPGYIETQFVSTGKPGRPEKQFRLRLEEQTERTSINNFDFIISLSNKQDVIDLIKAGFPDDYRRNLAQMVGNILESTRNNHGELSLPETRKRIERQLRSNTDVMEILDLRELSREEKNNMLDQLSWNLIRIYLE